MAWGEELVTTAKELKSGDVVRVEGYIHSWWPSGTVAWSALPSAVVNAELLRLIKSKAAPQGQLTIRNLSRASRPMPWGPCLEKGLKP